MLSRFLAERYIRGILSIRRKSYWKYVPGYIILKDKVIDVGCGRT